MMDNDTIQAMRELLAEERQHTKQLFAEERQHTKQLLQEQKQEMQEEFRQMMQEELAPVKEDVRKIKSTLEHDISDKLKAAHEGHLLHTEKLDRIQASIDDMAPTVTALDVLHQMQKNH